MRWFLSSASPAGRRQQLIKLERGLDFHWFVYTGGGNRAEYDDNTKAKSEQAVAYYITTCMHGRFVMYVYSS